MRNYFINNLFLPVAIVHCIIIVNIYGCRIMPNRFIKLVGSHQIVAYNKKKNICYTLIGQLAFVQEPNHIFNSHMGILILINLIEVV